MITCLAKNAAAGSRRDIAHHPAAQKAEQVPLPRDARLQRQHPPQCTPVQHERDQRQQDCAQTPLIDPVGKQIAQKAEDHAAEADVDQPAPPKSQTPSPLTAAETTATTKKSLVLRSITSQPNTMNGMVLATRCAKPP